MPPKANMPLYCSRVWLKMQRKGMAPATKNLAKLVIRGGKGENKDLERMITFSWFVAWQILERLTYRSDSQKKIDKICFF